MPLQRCAARLTGPPKGARCTRNTVHESGRCWQHREDSDFLEPEDRCAGNGYLCGLPEAAHTGWQNGGPSHDFRPPKPAPKPERIATSEITTQWECTHCGAPQEVGGVADREWMECDVCGKDSYVLA